MRSPTLTWGRGQKWKAEAVRSSFEDNASVPGQRNKKKLPTARPAAQVSGCSCYLTQPPSHKGSLFQEVCQRRLKVHDRLGPPGMHGGFPTVSRVRLKPPSCSESTVSEDILCSRDEVETHEGAAFFSKNHRPITCQSVLKL